MGAAAGVVALALLACGCGTDRNTITGTLSGVTGRPAGGSGCVRTAISGGGSTFVQTLVQQWVAGYERLCPSSTVNYQGVGSGAGIQQLSAGTIDFAGSDVPATTRERAALSARGGPIVEIPWAAGGIAVEYHIEGVPSLNLSARTVASIFAGRVARWDDPALRADNPHRFLPAEPIQVFHRSDGSGTTAAFTAYLSAAAPDVWRAGSAKQVDWPAGVGVKGSDQMTAAVRQSEGSIGYAEVSYARGAAVDVARIRNSSGRFVSPTATAVSAALRSAAVPPDLVVMPDPRPAAAGAYPISTFTFAVVFSRPPPGPKAALLKSFLNFALGAGQAAVTRLDYAPLPTRLLALDRAAVDQIGA